MDKRRSSYFVTRTLNLFDVLNDTYSVHNIKRGLGQHIEENKVKLSVRML
jgi:hypothetical protein